MRTTALWLFAGSLLVLLSACRTPVRPSAVPVANLYPTLHPSAVLESSRPLVLSEGDLSALLAHVGVLGPLRVHGMSAAELSLARRALERHGYAELDARRTACPVRWVVLRGVAEDGGSALSVEAALSAPPAAAGQGSIDLRRPPATVETRTGRGGSTVTVETWSGTADQAAVAVRRVSPAGSSPTWELHCRTRVRGAAPPRP
ncbi:MAG: hypothetical protein GX595_16365 [Lentisphaerae bacterium]|nr:hypothetical protein [Lentisphaerota bacterium]